MFPKIVLGIFERMSIFSAVVFNAVLGGYLFAGRFVYERKNIIEKERLFLREMTEKDYDELYMVLADSDIMQQINGSFIGQWIYAALVWVGAFGCYNLRFVGRF